jgi:hypothetical protein
MTSEQGYRQKNRRICPPFPRHKVMMSCNGGRCWFSGPRRAFGVSENDGNRAKNARFGPIMGLCGLCHAVLRVFCVTRRKAVAKVMPKSCQSHAKVMLRQALPLLFCPDQGYSPMSERLCSASTGILLVLYHAATEMATRSMRSAYQPYHLEVS